MTAQLDVFRDDPKRIAQAWRVAAETALHDVQFTDAERQKRHAYYLAEAERLDRV
jgi:hypothetical protein